MFRLFKKYLHTITFYDKIKIVKENVVSTDYKSRKRVTMNKSKTTFETINTTLSVLSDYITVQNNEVNLYARICTVDDYKKDNYKIMKDFAIYYDRIDSYKISIADSTLTDCKVFKEKHEKTEKTKALEFTVKSDKLFDTVCEILKQRLSQTDKKFTFTEKKTKARKASTTKKESA